MPYKIRRCWLHGVATRNRRDCCELTVFGRSLLDCVERASTCASVRCALQAEHCCVQWGEQTGAPNAGYHPTQDCSRLDQMGICPLVWRATTCGVVVEERWLSGRK